MLELKTRTQNPKPNAIAECFERAVMYCNLSQGSSNAYLGSAKCQKGNFVKVCVLVVVASAFQASHRALQSPRPLGKANEPISAVEVIKSNSRSLYERAPFKPLRERHLRGESLE